MAKANMMLRLYRPDDDGPDGVPPASAVRPLPWWHGRQRLTVGQFLSAFGTSDANHAALGLAVKRHACEVGREAEATKAPSTNFGQITLWPTDLLVSFFDGRLVGGQLLDTAWLRTVKAEPMRAAA